MKKAVDCVLVGKLSVREASGHFSVPKSSLGDRVCALKKGKSIEMAPSMGRFKKTFNEELENDLVKHLKYLDSSFLPVNKTELLTLAYDLAEHFKLPHQFNKTKKIVSRILFALCSINKPAASSRVQQGTSGRLFFQIRGTDGEIFISSKQDL